MSNVLSETLATQEISKTPSLNDYKLVKKDVKTVFDPFPHYEIDKHSVTNSLRTHTESLVGISAVAWWEAQFNLSQQYALYNLSLIHI